MKKTFCSLLSAIILLALSACSNDPFVGRWMPENDTSGTSYLELNSDGTMAMITDADDGYAKISGSWTRASDSENSVKLRLDMNTMELDFDNPLNELLVRQILEEYATSIIDASFVLSSDSKSLNYSEDATKAFVRM